MFEEVALPICRSVLDGVHGAVLAYGQTSSGKTHTIHGSPGDTGLVPRVLDFFVSERERLSHHSATEIEFTVSFVECYNERIYDLLEACDCCGGVTDEPQGDASARSSTRCKCYFDCGHVTCATCSTRYSARPSRCPCCTVGALKSRRGVVSGLALNDNGASGIWVSGATEIALADRRTVEHVLERASRRRLLGF